MNKRRLAAIAVAATLAVGAGVVGGIAWLKEDQKERWLAGLPFLAREKYEMIAGEDPAEAGRESAEAATLDAQFAEARQAPGIVSPGAYSSAFAQILGMAHTTGTWSDVTRLPYNADDARYRDYYSNSSGGAGYVTG